MKKIIFCVVALLMFCATTTAQVYNMGTTTADTITDTGSKTYAKQVVAPAQAKVSIQVIVNKLSGTAAGTAVVYGAISTNTATGGDTTCWVPTGDTLTVTNTAVNSKIFQYNNGLYTNYRVVITGSGTMTTRNRVFMYIRREN